MIVKSANYAWGVQKWVQFSGFPCYSRLKNEGKTRKIPLLYRVYTLNLLRYLEYPELALLFCISEYKLSGIIFDLVLFEEVHKFVVFWNYSDAVSLRWTEISKRCSSQTVIDMNLIRLATYRERFKQVYRQYAGLSNYR